MSLAITLSSFNAMDCRRHDYHITLWRKEGMLEGRGWRSNLNRCRSQTHYSSISCTLYSSVSRTPYSFVTHTLLCRPSHTRRASYSAGNPVALHPAEADNQSVRVSCIQIVESGLEVYIIGVLATCTPQMDWPGLRRNVQQPTILYQGWSISILN